MCEDHLPIQDTYFQCGPETEEENNFGHASKGEKKSCKIEISNCLKNEDDKKEPVSKETKKYSRKIVLRLVICVNHSMRYFRIAAHWWNDSLLAPKQKIDISIVDQSSRRARRKEERCLQRPGKRERERKDNAHLQKKTSFGFKAQERLFGKVNH